LFTIIDACASAYLLALDIIIMQLLKKKYSNWRNWPDKKKHWLPSPEPIQKIVYRANGI
jgi:hypothetical protein